MFIFDDPLYQLTPEQTFKVELVKSQIENLTVEQLQRLYVQLYIQLLKKDSLIEKTLENLKSINIEGIINE